MIVKELPRKTVCTLFPIRAPMWMGNSGKRVVGLALYRIGVHNEIEFTYRRKSDGELSYPDRYYISGEKIKALDFEHQNRKGTVLVLIPFDQLERLVRV